MKKRNILFVFAIAATTMFYSCSKEKGCTDATATNFDNDAEEDDGSCVYPDNNSGNQKVENNITSNTTWSSDVVYQLSGRIVVESGATLTIEPGTIIKAEGGKEASASVLIIARGGKIMAEGTAASPIIFTSILDEIEPGEISSPNLDESFNGLWGGLIVLGNATISADASEVQIEGIPVTDANGLYGGSNDADNSGIISYVSIRHGGTLLGEGNEINGLTLGGVGSGTTINHVEVVGNLDDGIEFFGGTVNASNLLVWSQGDDAIDIDQGYSGTINNVITIGSSNSDHALEIDGPEGSSTGSFTLTNGTFIGYNEDGECGDGGEYADFRDGARGSLSNLYFKNFCEDADFELDDDVTHNNAVAGDLSFADIQVNVSHLTAGNMTIDAIFQDKSAIGGFTNFNATIVTTATVGANDSEFSSWTWASKKGAF